MTKGMAHTARWRAKAGWVSAAMRRNSNFDSARLMARSISKTFASEVHEYARGNTRIFSLKHEGRMRLFFCVRGSRAVRIDLQGWQSAVAKL